MRFNRANYSDDLGRLRLDRRPVARAIGDNFSFEENVGPERLADFEAFAPIDPGLRGAAAGYFWDSVQGSERTHTPSTFQSLNGKALLDAGIERTQKIVRIERIDEPLDKLYRLEAVNFERLRDAVASRDSTIVAPFIRTLNEFPGARPAFACFKAEIAVEVREGDWFAKLRARLGLGHWALAAGEVGHFALMEYTGEEIFRQTSLAQPFAVRPFLRPEIASFSSRPRTGSALDTRLTSTTMERAIRFARFCIFG